MGLWYSGYADFKCVTLITQRVHPEQIEWRKVLGKWQGRKHQESLPTSTSVALAESTSCNYFATLGSVEDQRQLPKEGMGGKFSQFHSLSGLSSTALYPSTTASQVASSAGFSGTASTAKSTLSLNIGDHALLTAACGHWVAKRWAASFHLLPLLQALPTLAKVTSREI